MEFYGKIAVFVIMAFIHSLRINLTNIWESSGHAARWDALSLNSFGGVGIWHSGYYVQSIRQPLPVSPSNAFYDL